VKKLKYYFGLLVLLAAFGLLNYGFYHAIRYGVAPAVVQVLAWAGWWKFNCFLWRKLEDHYLYPST
jgi:hypothetical protein